MERAKALLLVAVGATFTTAGQEAGLSGEAVAQLVRRFNPRGLAILETAPGRDHKPTYTSKRKGIQRFSHMSTNTAGPPNS